MANTPLKAASRALSLATLLVAGFAAWVLCTQGSQPNHNASPLEIDPHSVTFAAVTEPTSKDRFEDVSTQSPSQRRPDADISPSKPKPKPRTLDDDDFFDELRVEPKHLTDTAKSQRTTASRQQPRIQPELGRFSNRELNAIAPEEFSDENSVTEELFRQPQPRKTSGGTGSVFRPVDVVQDAGAKRIDAQLSELKRKIDQFAQVQTEQKSSDQRRAAEFLQQLQQQKQSEQIEKLTQQLQEALQKETDPTKALDTAKSAIASVAAGSQKRGQAMLEKLIKDSPRNRGRSRSRVDPAPNRSEVS